MYRFVIITLCVLLSNFMSLFSIKAIANDVKYKLIRQEKGMPFANQVKEDNTVYDIVNDIDLGCDSIFLPKGCCLKFSGGKISNGFLWGNDTQIEAAKEIIFDGSLTLCGNWKADIAYPEWFGAAGDGMNDDLKAIQKSISIFSAIEFNRYYKVSDKIVLDSYKTLVGSNNAVIEISDTERINYVLQTPHVGSYKEISIKGITFIGHCSHETYHETGLCAVELVNVDAVDIGDCLFTGFNKNVEITKCTNVLIDNNSILDATETSNKINGYGILIEGGDSINIVNNRMYNIERHGIYLNSPSNVLVSNNYIEGQTNNLERFSHWEGNIKVNGVRNVLIKDNVSIGNYYGISIMSGFREKGFCGQNIKIENNIIKNCIRNPGFGFGAISFPESGTLNNVTIINNIIENELEYNRCVYRGINIENFSSSNIRYSFDNVMMSGNRIKGFPTKCRISLSNQFKLNDNVISGKYELSRDTDDNSCNFVINDF